MRTPRLEPQAEPRSLLEALGLGATAPVVSEIGEAEFEATSLPPDHPKWARDALTVSHRARDIVARLKPLAIRVLTFWDHRLRAIQIGTRRLHVDPSGSYRLERY